MTRKPPATESTTGAAMSGVNSILSAQLETLADIEAILAEEHAALDSRNPDALLAATHSKSAALERLNELETMRKSISEDLGSEQLAALSDLTTRCRNMNQRNAAQLNTQRQHIDRLLCLLRGSSNSQPESYDASGKVSGKAAKQLRLTQA